MKDSKLLIIIPTAQVNDRNLIKTLVTLLKNTKEYEYDLLVIKNNFRGFAKTVNKGLKIVVKNKTYLGCILLNDDIVIKDRNWLDLLLEKKTDGDIIGCKDELRTYYVPFWCVFIRREVIEKIGFLDERFVVGEWEDIDYCIRAINAGFRIVESDARVFHREHGTLDHLDKHQKILVKKNWAIFLKKYKKTKWEKIFRDKDWWFNLRS